MKNGKFGAAFVLLQGLVTALFPKTSVGFVTNSIEKYFENAEDLKPRSSYLRQLRALGVGMVAAGGTSLLLQSLDETDDEVDDTDDTDAE